MTDIVTFSTFCGCYASGAKTTFIDSDGRTHVIKGSGDLPRTYTLNEEPISFDYLKRLTRGRRLGRFISL